MEVLKIILEVGLVLGLVAANGFFVAAEFALVKIRASQLRPLARNGGWRVRMALFATTHPVERGARAARLNRKRRRRGAAPTGSCGAAGSA